MNKVVERKKEKTYTKYTGTDNVMLCQAGQKVLGYIEENERKTLFRIMRGK
jgi:hypothetical protein